MENMFIRHFLSQNRLPKQLIVNNICHYFWLSINILLSFICQNKFTCVKWTNLLEPNRHMQALATLQAAIRNYNIANIVTCKQNSEISHHFSNHWACRANTYYILNVSLFDGLVLKVNDSETFFEDFKCCAFLGNLYPDLNPCHISLRKLQTK